MDDFLKKIKADSEAKDFGSKKNEAAFFYNKEGDCVQFQLKDMATTRERVDDYLTIYRSYADSKPIGFQIKDVHALISEHDLEVFEISTTVHNEEITSIALKLILKALIQEENMPINRISGYVNALQVFTRDVAKA